MSKIAILGFGTVGSGTVEVFCKNKSNYCKNTGKNLDIKYILDIRDFPESPYADKFIKDFNVIVNDPEVTVVAELIGGKTFAYDCVKRALEAGKSVVTSNKELVATKGAELLRIAAEHNVNFFFEASVGGGIPIIRPLQQCLMSDEITSIAGILNGTTNYILTKMLKEGAEFAEVLAKAQELGYAESDPEADVGGGDACRKICILASLIFGEHIYPEDVYTEGITSITKEDAEYAANWGGVIKLIASAQKFGDCLEIVVCPCFVPVESQLSGVDDVFNAILVKGTATGEVVFYGRGAGKYPTASAVVADILNAVRNESKNIIWKEKGKESCVVDYEKQKHRFYLRANADKTKISGLFGDVSFLARQNAPESETAFITPEISREELNEKCKNMNVLGKIQIMYAFDEERT
ncbi:MAG: homoserine dehydrogenase [Oscillospiraceae bacterium]|jgi:homoserine dehydrogenase|nr:homoserine dehydrogenase [Oscillospiraceae bacterium]